MLRHVDPSAELVACGRDDAWYVTFLETLGRHTGLVDHLSIHRYWNGSGHATNFDDDQYYALLAEAQAMEDFIRDTARPDALAAAIALESFHRQCQVLTLANPAQIVNVLQAVVHGSGGLRPTTRCDSTPPTWARPRCWWSSVWVTVCPMDHLA